MGILKNFEGDGHDEEHIATVPPLDLIANATHISDASSSSEDDEVHVLGADSTPAVIETVSPPAVRTSKVKKLGSKMPKPILHVRSLGGKKSQGNRQVRRHENMCFLLNLARDLEEDFAEVNIDDLVEQSISAFAQLLLSKNKMKIWNDFIELPESQQERLIKLARNSHRKKNKSNESISQEKTLQRYPSDTTSSEENIDTFVIVEKMATTTIGDHEYNAPLRQQDESDACFRRIDRNIRFTLKSLLKRHQLPLERIAWFEDDVIPFFVEHPDSVYLRHLNHGFDRMILHAVCQYLNLISKSSTRDGERYTQVENRRAQFLPPKKLLSHYMKQLDDMAHSDS